MSVKSAANIRPIGTCGSQRSAETPAIPAPPQGAGHDRIRTSDLCSPGSYTFFLRAVTVHVACASKHEHCLSSQMVSGDNDRSPAERICPYPNDLQHGLLCILHRHLSHSRGAERESATGAVSLVALQVLWAGKYGSALAVGDGTADELNRAAA